MKTLDLNNTSMIELSTAEMRQTEGGWIVLGIVVVLIFLVGVHDGATAP